MSFRPIVIMTYIFNTTCIRQSIYMLQGHTGTIRCLKVLHNRPIAVTGSQDKTLRVWDIGKGQQLYELLGHNDTVRCLDICGNRVVSGSYDATCKVGLVRNQVVSLQR